MPSTFTDDLKHMVKDAASGARDRLTAIQGGVQPTLVKMRALPAATKKKIAVAGVAVAVLGLGLAVRGGKSPASERIADRPTLRGSDLATCRWMLRGRRRAPPRGAWRWARRKRSRRVQGRRRELPGRRAEGRWTGLKKLVAMTHAPKCEARSEAADALGTMKSKKATAALKKLARSRSRTSPAARESSPAAAVARPRRLSSARRAAELTFPWVSADGAMAPSAHALRCGKSGATRHPLA